MRIGEVHKGTVIPPSKVLKTPSLARNVTRPRLEENLLGFLPFVVTVKSASTVKNGKTIPTLENLVNISIMLSRWFRGLVWRRHSIRWMEEPLKHKALVVHHPTAERARLATNVRPIHEGFGQRDIACLTNLRDLELKALLRYRGRWHAQI